MKAPKLYLFAFLSMMCSICYAQPQARCHTMAVNSKEDLKNFEKNLSHYLEQHSADRTNRSMILIPVVFHIIHNSNESPGNGRNIPYARITEQIMILNDDFRRQNADTIDTPAHFKPFATDTEINFCLVTEYPQGHPNAGQSLPEPGVNRIDVTSLGLSDNTSGYSSSEFDDSIKVVTQWDPNEVMNVWICELSNNIAGYATFPVSGPANKDGIVVGYQYVGNTSTPGYETGRILTHETGHFLGLYHIWGDDGSACTGSDQCADTPNQAGPTLGNCPNIIMHDACTPSGDGIMWNNFMDYSFGHCLDMFTFDQKARMLATLSTEPRRMTLSGASPTLCPSEATSIREIGITDIQIYPNPTSDYITISTDLFHSHAQGLIFDLAGRVVSQFYTFNGTDTKVDVTHLEPGVYSISLSNSSQRSTGRFVKM